MAVVRKLFFQYFKFYWCHYQFLTWKATSWRIYFVWLHVHLLIKVIRIINLSKRYLRFFRGRQLQQQKFLRKRKTTFLLRATKWLLMKKCFNNWPAQWNSFNLWVFSKAFYTDYSAVSTVFVKKREIDKENSISLWNRANLI